MLPPTLEQAHEEIGTLRREVDRLTARIAFDDDTVEDLATQVRFWRQAAEHAVAGWNRIEDEHELLKDTLRALVRDDAPADEPELPEADKSGRIDLGEGVVLRVVETETPRKP